MDLGAAKLQLLVVKENKFERNSIKVFNNVPKAKTKSFF